MGIDSAAEQKAIAAGDLERFLRSAFRALKPTGATLRHLMAEAPSDAVLRRALQERLIEPRRETLRKLLSLWCRLLLDEALHDHFAADLAKLTGVTFVGYGRGRSEARHKPSGKQSTVCCWRFSSRRPRTAAPGRSATVDLLPRTAQVSDFRLLSHFERVVNLDSKISHSTFELGVAQQQLHGSQVLSATID